VTEEIGLRVLSGRRIVRCMTVVLTIAAAGERPELCVRPWLAVDMPDLLAAMAGEYADRGLWSHPDIDVPGPQRWTGPRNQAEAVLWLAGQERGWAGGDWLTFAVLDAARKTVAGHVGLKNRDGGRVGTGERGEIGFWTAPDARGRGIAPTAVRAVTDWAFRSFGATGLPCIMLVHDVENAASCRVAAKSGYPFGELSPANPPYWLTDGHIHLAEATAR
jgi:RimJ/RimL family protein N-acetyltransferase